MPTADLDLSREEFAVILDMVRQRKRPLVDRPPLAYGYVQCSNDEAKRTGVSPLDQRNTIQAYRALLLQKDAAVEEGEIFQDIGQSALKKALHQRPEGAKLIGALQPGDHVIFAKADRGFRNLLDQLKQMELWEKEGIHAHAVDVSLDTTTPVGKMLMHIIGAFNQYEGERIAERNKAMAVARRKKLRSDWLPSGNHDVIGFAKRGQKGNRRPALQEDRIEWMKWLITLREEYRLSWRNMAQLCEIRVVQLAESGILKQKWRDHPWSLHQARRWYLRGLELKARGWKPQMPADQQKQAQ